MALIGVVMLRIEIGCTHVAVFVCHFLHRTFLLASGFDRIAIGRHVDFLVGATCIGLSGAPQRAHMRFHRVHKIATRVSNLGGGDGVPMKSLYIASALLAATVAGCGTLSVPGTPETATSLN